MKCSNLSFRTKKYTFIKFQGVAGIYSPNTGIVDYGAVARHYGKRFEGMGGVVVKDYEVSFYYLITVKFIAQKLNSIELGLAGAK